jgi:hypothetical protein
MQDPGFTMQSAGMPPSCIVHLGSCILFVGQQHHDERLESKTADGMQQCRRLSQQNESSGAGPSPLQASFAG